MKRFGEKLRALRLAAGWSYRGLAEKLAASDTYSTMSYGYLSQLEKGVKRPSADFVLAIARLFAVTTDSLMMDEIDLDTTNEHDAQE